MADSIIIHGRSGYTASVRRDRAGVQIDLSTSTVFFEVADSDLRVPLTVDPTDAKALRVTLTRSQVETLPGVPVAFALVDETQALPQVIGTGTIQRAGFVRQTI